MPFFDFLLEPVLEEVAPDLLGGVFGDYGGELLGDFGGDVLGDYGGDLLGDYGGDLLGDYGGDYGDILGDYGGDYSDAYDFGNDYGGDYGDTGIDFGDNSGIDFNNVAFDEEGNMLPGYEVDPSTGVPKWTGNMPSPSILSQLGKTLFGDSTGSSKKGGGGLLGSLGSLLGFGGGSSKSGGLMDSLLPLLGGAAAGYFLPKLLGGGSSGGGSSAHIDSPSYYNQFANQPKYDFSAGFGTPGTPGPAVNPVAAYNPQMAQQMPNQNQYVYGGQPVTGPISPIDPMLAEKIKLERYGEL
jgi:hypothetical protein